MTLGPLKLQNPVMTASGCCGFGPEMEDFFDLSVPGALVLKTVTLNPRIGNPSPRLAETPSGLLNSIGLPNPGVRAFLKNLLPLVRNKPSCLVVNFAGEREPEFAEAAKLLDGADGIDALEMNLSCPNVEGGRLPFGTDPVTVKRIVASVRAVTGLPLLVKLSPNVTDIVPIAEAALDGGGDVLTVANTLLGMSIDWRERKARLGTGFGGLSGPAVMPVALRLVHQVWTALRCPIVGVGGVTTADDVMAYLVTGAAAVQAGTACFMDPLAIPNMIDGVAGRVEEEGIASLDECVGSLKF